MLLLFCGYQLWWTDVTSNAATQGAPNALDAAASPQTPASSTARSRRSATPDDGRAVRADVRAEVRRELGASRSSRASTSPTCTRASATTRSRRCPGEVGNFAVAGHRTTNGHPFRKIDELEVGDKIFVETKDAWYTYTVDRRRASSSTRRTLLRRRRRCRKDATARTPTEKLHDADQLPPAVQRVAAHDRPRELTDVRAACARTARRAHRPAPPRLARRLRTDTSADRPLTVDRPGRHLVYGWMWRKLPGNWALKTLESLVLIVVGLRAARRRRVPVGRAEAAVLRTTPSTATAARRSTDAHADRRRRPRPRPTAVADRPDRRRRTAGDD